MNGTMSPGSDELLTHRDAAESGPVHGENGPAGVVPRAMRRWVWRS